jgi:dipeptidyl aminopeptidase/acylaminoacyl peptidase
MKRTVFLAISICYVFGTTNCGDGATGPDEGSLRVAASTSGADLDPDGYSVRLDGATSRPVGINDTARFDNISTGPHSVELLDLADNCLAAGDNPRDVTVVSTVVGLTRTTFNVVCVAVTGSIEVETVTAGDTLDPDGYSVTVDGVTRGIGLNDTDTFSGLAEGDYSVELTGIAKNCTTAQPNPQAVSVARGATSPMTFNVDCKPAIFDRIAFTAEAQRTQILVMKPDGSDVITLLADDANNRNPAFSPDGTKLAFVSDRDSCDDIWVMNVDGSGLERLTGDCSSRGPAWSPDGARIAFYNTSDGDAEIYVMNADGTLNHRLTNNATVDLSPSWSPDGTRIAFYSDRDGNAEIYFMIDDGSDQVNFTQNPALDRHPAWSPMGGEIAFASDRAGVGDIHTQNTDHTGLTNLTDGATSGSWNPTWSPDGTRIAFVGFDLHTSQIFVMDADGSSMAQVSNVMDAAAPAWAPERQ